MTPLKLQDNGGLSMATIKLQTNASIIKGPTQTPGQWKPPQWPHKTSRLVKITSLALHKLQANRSPSKTPLKLQATQWNTSKYPHKKN